MDPCRRLNNTLYSLSLFSRALYMDLEATKSSIAEWYFFVSSNSTEICQFPFFSRHVHEASKTASFLCEATWHKKSQSQSLSMALLAPNINLASIFSPVPQAIPFRSSFCLTGAKATAQKLGTSVAQPGSPPACRYRYVSLSVVLCSA